MINFIVEEIPSIQDRQQDNKDKRDKKNSGMSFSEILENDMKGRGYVKASLTEILERSK